MIRRQWFEPFGYEVRIVMNRGQLETVAARVDETMGGPGWRDDDIARTPLHLGFVDEETAGPCVDDEDLLVRMTVQVRSVARLNVDQDQRQTRAMLLPLELARAVASGELVGVNQPVHTTV